MASFRIIDQARTFFGQQGQLLPGGSLLFTVAGTTTPVNVYGNRALGTNNGSTVALDSSGRPTLDVWGDTAVLYRMRVYDVASVLQADVDNIEVPGGAGQTIPIPASGEFITGDGSNFLKATIRQVPDPAGNANKILGTDGTVWTWVAKPTDGTPGAAGVANITNAANSVTMGTAMTQWGTGTAPATGAPQSSQTITFSPAFTATPAVTVTPTSDSNAGGPAVPEITSISTTGFTVQFDIAEGGGSSSGVNVTNPVPFNWTATGAKV